jgi:HAD superfamily hydrolase (TIGR01509 family)
MKKLTLLFDFDGTLVDSMSTYSNMMIRILDEYEVKYPDDIIKIITPLGFVGTADYFIEKLGLCETRETLISKMTEYAIEEYTYNVPAKEHVADTLSRLREEGASLNVLTASPHDTLDPCLKRLGLYDVFDNVWSCNDFATTKSDPEIYRAAAERMGVEVENVVFLDDNINADITAKNAGMQVLGVYDDSSREFEGEMRSVCNGYIRDFSELPAALTALKY